VSGKGR